MQFTILGPVRAWRGEKEVTLGPPQQRVLLAVLLAHAGQPVGMDTMVDVLWGEAPPTTAVNAVYRQMGELRRRLEPGLPLRVAGRWLVRASGGYQLNADVDTVDLLRFRDLVGRARAANQDGGLDKSVALFLEAVALRQGPAAAGIPADSRAHPAFVALDREYLIAVKEAADAALDHGAAERFLMVLHRVAAEHPLDEPLQARLVLVLAAAGHRAEALDTWQKVRAGLAEELGISPGPELREAQKRILGTYGRAARGDTDRLTDSAAKGLGHTIAVPRTAPVRPTSPLVHPLAQLPADLPVFAGRRADLARARSLLCGKEAMTPATGILAISGMGGVGKSTLAVHLSHQLAQRYPDGQLYVNLRGFGPSTTAMDPREAVRGFLTALGLSPQRIPADPDGEAGAYRSLLADRKVLILLDNARDSAQVRPLLPGTHNCSVIVTSRNGLLGLVASHGAQILELDPIPTTEARDLLVRRIGATRITADSRAAAEILRHCAGLPLALTVVATRAAARPNFPLTAIAAELSEAQGSLDAFADPEPANDVRTVFSWSYQTLSSDAARLLRLLALHPGPDSGAPAAAALIGLPLTRTRHLLAELTRAHLLSEHAPGRYICHDLLRTYAAELAERHDSQPQREGAVQRLLDHYLYTADAAGQLHSPWWMTTALPQALAGGTSESLEDDGQALRWYTAERHVLREVVDFAAQIGFDTHAWQLCWALERFWDRQGHWHESEAVHRIALAAATRAGHRPADSRAVFASMDHRAADEIRTELKDLGNAIPAPRIALVPEE
ncbi:BTAD domain-containing putative transcriptional regulator [Streptomyces sp. NPDC056672]|uniref:AfsR/SARP family transcriptional regulator n=1 Tax=Streptomyces sp. NPDC056672 TaxID=3345906 RepID=UPI0036CCCFB0